MTPLLLALLACDRTATLADGRYELVELRRADGSVEIPETAPDLVVAGLEVQVGDDVRTAEPLPWADWPEGCPTQVGAARQESWAISGPLTPAAGTTFPTPFLVAACGAESGPAAQVLLVDGAPGDFEPCGSRTCARYQLPRD